MKLTKRFFMGAMGLIFFILHSTAQPNYQRNRMIREQLNRGVIALPTERGEVMVSWRQLLKDAPDAKFEVFRNGEKLADVDGTCFIDSHPLLTHSSTADTTGLRECIYEVRGGCCNGQFVLRAGAPVGYLPIPLQRPADSTTPDGRTFSYSANDASVGDVDGDGEYEIFLKWDPSNAHDNAHDGFTGNTLFDCYRMDGTLLWRIDMGPNIRSGAHYVPFIVYDLDGDGCAEMLVRTADGTRDAKGKVIGDSTADWRIGVKEAMDHYEENRLTAQEEREEMEKMRQQWINMQREGKRAERPRWSRKAKQWKGLVRNVGRVIEGRDYLTLFNGKTGEAMATVDFIPQRGDSRDWGDDRANRSDRFLGGVGYFDGIRPAAFISRGYYGRTVVATWQWDGKELTNQWTFDTNDEEWHDYAGQGNHNLRIADLDGDGCDEIIMGSMAIDHDGRGLYNTGMGHGDAMHLTVFDPSSTRLMLWDCHENRRDGSELRDAATGEVIFKIESREDVGRCMAADIDASNPGLEMWSIDSHGIRNIKGEVVCDKVQLPINFAVWWDGDRLREMLDHAVVSKFNAETGRCEPLLRMEGCSFNNGTKSNPCLSGDLMGDWREEVLVRTNDSSELRLYSTTIPTVHRIGCLMEDIPYRLSIATENVGYNQPPHVGFYLGE